jgi:hypothetical protein
MSVPEPLANLLRPLVGKDKRAPLPHRLCDAHARLATTGPSSDHLERLARPSRTAMPNVGVPELEAADIQRIYDRSSGAFYA